MNQQITHRKIASPEVRPGENNPWFNLAKPLMGMTDVVLGNVDVYKLKEENEHYKILVENLRQNLEIETKNVEKIILENIKITEKDKARRMNQLSALRRADEVFLQQYKKHGILDTLSGKSLPKPPDVPDDFFDLRLPDGYHHVVAMAKARNPHAFTTQNHLDQVHSSSSSAHHGNNITVNASPGAVADLFNGVAYFQPPGR